MRNVLITQAKWDGERMFRRTMSDLKGIARVIANEKETPMTAMEVIQAGKADRIDVIVTGWGGCPITPEVIDHAPDLRLLAVFGGTIKPHAPEYAFARGIRFCHCPRAMGWYVAEFTIGLIMAMNYEIPYLDRLFREEKTTAPPEGAYQRRGGFTARSLRYSRVGLIGSGHIARHVIRMLAPFECRIAVYDPYLTAEAAAALGVQKEESLEELLRIADILSVHAGWTPETEGMLTAERLALLKDDAVVICTARLPIFDEAALKREALSGRLRVGLNVIPENPLWFEDDVKAVRRLCLTPGSNSVADSTWTDMGDMLLQDVIGFLESGKITHEVRADDLGRMT